jgi:hypothetical protein
MQRMESLQAILRKRGILASLTCRVSSKHLTSKSGGHGYRFNSVASRLSERHTAIASNHDLASWEY